MIVIFMLVGFYTGYVFYFAVKNTVKQIAAETNLPSSPHMVDLSLPLATFQLTGNGILPIVLPIPLRNEQMQATGVTGVPLPNYQRKERVNILLLGVDQRPDETYSRTDTMIVVTIDPDGKTAGMLSIPRDLYVPIPGYDEENRINMAYFLGEKDNYPGGGPALAMQTIQDNLGIPVHFYLRVDFDGFQKIVNTLDGIEIDVPETIDDPTYPDNNYGFDPYYIEAGLHTMNGYDALRYARTRHSSSDFSRARRQQQVLMAIRGKALQLGMIPKIPELWNTLSDSLDTTLQLVDLIELARLSSEIDPSTMKNGVIDNDYTTEYVTEQGAQVLLPLNDKIKILIDDIFSTPSSGPTEAEIEAQRQAEMAVQAQAKAKADSIQQNVQRQEEIKANLSKENGKLVVQNGTSDAPGLAAKTAMYLKQLGFNITQFGPVDTVVYPHTVIVVYDESKVNTLQLLATIFEVREENVRRSPHQYSDIDFRVIIGSDFKLPSEASSLAGTK